MEMLAGFILGFMVCVWLFKRLFERNKLYDENGELLDLRESQGGQDEEVADSPHAATNL